MKYALLAAMAVAVAPFAHAQDCGPLEQVLTAAEDRFRSIMVEELDDGFFDTSIYLLGADECAVDSVETSYYCLWSWPTVAEADKAIAPMTVNGQRQRRPSIRKTTAMSTPTMAVTR